MELQNGSQHFEAILKSDPRTWTTYAPGTRLQLTGVYASEDRENHGAATYPFEILLNNAAGIEVLQRPSWWTVRHTIMIAAALGAALGIAFIWITLLHRKVEQRTTQLQKEIEARQLVEQHRVMEQERARVARDLHDELGTGLTEVSMLGELGTNPAVTLEEKERCFQQITSSARALVTGLDEIVWAINPGYDSVSSAATYYSFFADRFLRLAGITCRLHIPAHLPEWPLASNVRHSVFLACKEALNNIVRHSGASEVEFKVEAPDQELFIGIRDNGKGIQSGGFTPGNDGVLGMQKRLQEFGGSCRITGEPGKGTTVEFRLPLRLFFKADSGAVSADCPQAGNVEADPPRYDKRSDC
ncbi:MAG TPA: ATP-binding protein [Verrucomicrobiae bacterium]|nr:ATP-binding protein [Verrucomicrobiae bacterium]